MAKKNDRSARTRRPPRQINLIDKTAERYFEQQIAKAERLYENGKFNEAIELLLPMQEKYGDRVAWLETLGINYAAGGLLPEARESLEQAVELAGHKTSHLTRFNLAQIYVLTGLNFLAFEQAQLMDCYELARETNDNSNLDQCRNFRDDCTRLVEKTAAENNQPLNSFLDFALALDRGRLAMANQLFTTAEGYFQEAALLNPGAVVPLNNLALVYMLTARLPEADATLSKVLELDANNRTALSLLVRLLVIDRNLPLAQATLERLEALPTPHDADEFLKNAEAFAALDDDKTVINTTQYLLSQRNLADNLDPASYEETITFAVVAAANLGRNRQAAEFLRTARRFTRPTLLERTMFALENNERGPRPQGRFFYFDPVSAFPPAAIKFQELAVALDENADFDYKAGLRQFFQQFGEPALDIAAYKFWIDRDPELVQDILEEALRSEIAGSADMVRRLAFTRTGDDLQRLTALKALIEVGIVKPEESVKVWQGQRQAVGTYPVLMARYRKFTEQEQQGAAVPQSYDANTSASLNEALDLMVQGKRDQAIVLYRKIIERNPKVKQAYQNLAALLSGMGDNAGAIEALQNALQIDPSYTYARIALAQLLVVTNQLTEAQTYLQEIEPRLAELFVDELEAFYAARIALYRKQNQLEAMKSDLKKLLELDATSEWALELLRKLENDEISVEK